MMLVAGAYPGGRLPGGPSESLILAPLSKVEECQFGALNFSPGALLRLEWHWGRSRNFFYDRGEGDAQMKD